MARIIGINKGIIEEEEEVERREKSERWAVGGVEEEEGNPLTSVIK